MLRHRDNSRRLEPSSLPFYHGSMTSKLASNILIRESPGTFLLRKLADSDQLYLSYKTVNTKTILHSVINFTEDSHCFIEQCDLTSTSIRRLVEKLKTQGFLTIGLTQISPYHTFTPTNSEERSDSIDQDSDQESEFSFIPHITKEEAEEKLVSSRVGTWLLRRNDHGQLRVSFVANTKVKHKQLYQHPGQVFTMTERETETPVSLGEIISELKKQKIIKNRLSES